MAYARCETYHRKTVVLRTCGQDEEYGVCRDLLRGRQREEALGRRRGPRAAANMSTASLSPIICTCLDHGACRRRRCSARREPQAAALADHCSKQGGDLAQERCSM